MDYLIIKKFHKKDLKMKFIDFFKKKACIYIIKFTMYKYKFLKKTIMIKNLKMIIFCKTMILC